MRRFHLTQLLQREEDGQLGAARAAQLIREHKVELAPRRQPEGKLLLERLIAEDRRELRELVDDILARVEEDSSDLITFCDKRLRKRRKKKKLEEDEEIKEPWDEIDEETGYNIPDIKRY